MGKYLLAHDIGTSGNKATIYSQNGQIIARHVSSYPVHYFNDTWAEQNPDDWWWAVVTSTKILTEKINVSDIAALSFSGQMNGCVCIDKEGSIIRPSIIWADQRAVKQAQWLNENIGLQEFYKTFYHRPSATRTLEKAMWLKENERPTYDRIYKIIQSKDYIAYKFTGVIATDYSDASQYNMFDISKKRWATDIIKEAGIDATKLPETMRSTAQIGTVTSQAASLTGILEGTPVIIGAGDGVAVSVGAGCVENEQIYACIGTSAWCGLSLDKPVSDYEKMRSYATIHAVPGMYMNYCTMQSAGSSYNWMKEQIFKKEECGNAEKDIYASINSEIEKSPVGSNGLIYLPYLLGERSPYWNPKAKGAFIGMKMEHTREDLMRAVIEGVCLNMCINLEVLKEYSNKVESLILVGGAAKGKVWRKILCDIIALNVLIPEYFEEAASIGAAIVGGIGIGMFADFSVAKRNITFLEKIQADEQNKETYKKMLPIFTHAYKCLLPVFDSIARL